MRSKITFQIRIDDLNTLAPLCLFLEQLGITEQTDTIRIDPNKVAYIWVNELYERTSPAGETYWDEDYIDRYRLAAVPHGTLNEHPEGYTKNVVWPHDKEWIMRELNEAFHPLREQLKQIKKEIYG